MSTKPFDAQQYEVAAPEPLLKREDQSKFLQMAEQYAGKAPNKDEFGLTVNNGGSPEIWRRVEQNRKRLEEGPEARRQTIIDTLSRAQQLVTEGLIAQMKNSLPNDSAKAELDNILLGSFAQMIPEEIQLSIIQSEHLFYSDNKKSASAVVANVFKSPSPETWNQISTQADTMTLLEEKVLAANGEPLDKGAIDTSSLVNMGKGAQTLGAVLYTYGSRVKAQDAKKAGSPLDDFYTNPFLDAGVDLIGYGIAISEASTQNDKDLDTAVNNPIAAILNTQQKMESRQYSTKRVKVNEEEDFTLKGVKRDPADEAYSILPDDENAAWEDKEEPKESTLIDSTTQQISDTYRPRYPSDDKPQEIPDWLK